MPPKAAGSKNQVGPNGAVEPMRAEPDRLHDAADGAVRDELLRDPMVEGIRNRSEKQIEKMRPVSSTVISHGGQLLDAGHAGLVDHHVLAVPHGVDREPGTIDSGSPRR